MKQGERRVLNPGSGGLVAAEGKEMTEAQWLDYTDPDPFRRTMHPMLALLDSVERASQRKLRLFAVACCRRLLHKMSIHPWNAYGIDVAERYADGKASAAELEKASGYPPSNCQMELTHVRGGNRLTSTTERSPAPKSAINACWNAAELDGGIVMADCASGNAAWAATQTGSVMPDDNGVSDARFAAETVVQCDLIRCIFGNPFRPSTIAPAHRTATVVSLARAAYDERQMPSGELDPHRLAVLADALEEARAPGELVAHLRGPGPHTRGCWAVDLALGLS